MGSKDVVKIISGLLSIKFHNLTHIILHNIVVIFLLMNAYSSGCVQGYAFTFLINSEVVFDVVESGDVKFVQVCGILNKMKVFMID